MTDLNRRQKYALLRRRGWSRPEAADRAGYAGPASPKARKLVDEDGSWIDREAGEGGVERLKELRDRREELKFRLRVVKRRLEAREVLEAEERGEVIDERPRGGARE